MKGIRLEHEPAHRPAVPAGRVYLLGAACLILATSMGLRAPGIESGPTRQEMPSTRDAIDQAPIRGWTGDPRTLVPSVVPGATAQPDASPLPFINQDQDPGRTERHRLVAAATESGLDRLQRKIEAEFITKDLTVGQLLGKLPAGSRAQLRAMLAAAPQVGGPRFPVPGTAEVQLQVRSADVADFLVKLSAEAGEAAPIPPGELGRLLRGWRGITFHATGGSAAPDIALGLRLPPEKMPASWRGVTEENRQLTVAKAQSDAIDKLIVLVRPIKVRQDVPDPDAASPESTGAEPGNVEPSRPRPLTLETVLKTGSVEAEARAYLSGQPYRTMQYGEGREVEVRLAVEPEAWLEQLRVSMSHPELGIAPIPEEDWKRFSGEFARMLNTTDCEVITGRAIAPDPVENPALSLPERAPEWTRLPLTAQATAKFDPSANGRELASRRLAAGGEARAAARQALRARLDTLALGEDQTLGQIAQLHPAIASALDTAAANATVTRTNYGVDDATAHVSLNPVGLWQTLQRFAAEGPSRGHVAPPPDSD
jgi:hypothetical protein